MHSKTIHCATLFALLLMPRWLAASGNDGQLLTTHWPSATAYFLAIGGISAIWYAYQLKRRDNTLLRQKNLEIETQRTELAQQNASLDALNRQLVEEMAEREMEERRSFERESFLAGVAHRMGTPLNSIVGLTHFLLQENPRPEQRDQLKNLQFAANNLVVFINDMLDYSKIEAGKLTPAAIRFQPKRVFQDIREQFEAEGDERGLYMDFAFNSRIPKYLMGDPTRLHQILSNLFNTSLKYVHEGSISMRFNLVDEDDEMVLLNFEMHDSGKPIEPDVLSTVFAETTDDSVFEKQNSVVFALTIARRLVELQNGKMEIINRGANGNMYFVWLPLRKVSAEESLPRHEENRFREMAGIKALLVEDHKINQLVVAKLLRKLDVVVVTADNGLEALEAMKAQNFDLVLMDIQMPLLDGYRTTAEIRKMDDPVKKSVPIIALTASAFLTNEDKARLFGMDEYVGKPFSPEELLEKITRLLALRKKKVR
jgi:CheY-like chemotaxis protein/signal transduction histidine kinase